MFIPQSVHPCSWVSVTPALDPGLESTPVNPEVGPHVAPETSTCIHSISPESLRAVALVSTARADKNSLGFS